MNKGYRFSKYVGTGNDFLFFDKEESFSIKNRKHFVQKICDRHFGVGADGVVFMEESEKYDFEWDFYNADGSSAEMCGNAARCAVQFYGTSPMFQGKLTDPSVNPLSGDHSDIKIFFQTQSGVIEGQYSQQNLPIIKLKSPHFVKKVEDGELWEAGVPHFVLQKKLKPQGPLKDIGKSYRYHVEFQPHGVNVTFFCPSGQGNPEQDGLTEKTEVPEKQKVSPYDIERAEQETEKTSAPFTKCIDAVTYERGVEDLTLACGTGALAAASCYRKQMGGQHQSIQVRTRGGCLSVLFEQDKKVALQGPASHVFSGEFL